MIITTFCNRNNITRYKVITNEVGNSSGTEKTYLNYIFIRNSRIPKPCVIPQLDPRISSQRILKYPKNADKAREF